MAKARRAVHFEKPIVTMLVVVVDLLDAVHVFEERPDVVEAGSFKNAFNTEPVMNRLCVLASVSTVAKIAVAKLRVHLDEDIAVAGFLKEDARADFSRDYYDCTSLFSIRGLF